MYILGLNAFHGDCSACLFKDDKLLVAIEEERLTRIKHTAGFPVNSIKFCLDYERIKLNDIELVAVNRNPNQRIINKIIYAIKNAFNLKKLSNRISNLRKINSLENEFEKNFGAKLNKKVVLVDHHLSHAASSIYMSKYDSCNYITIDGFGDFLSTTIGTFSNHKINKLDEVQFPHSMGLFYTAITQFLGFKKYGDEYKIMGLSSYGKPSYVNQIERIISYDEKNLFKLNLDFFKHHKEGIEMSWLEGEPTISNIYSDNIIKILGEPRKDGEEITKVHMDIASSTQLVFETIFIKILNKLYHLNNSNSICISGGCAMNSLMNGKIIEKTKYKNIYINHSPGDSGGSIGAAIIAIKNNIKTDFVVEDNPYLGPKFNNDEIKKNLDDYQKLFKENNILIKKFDTDDSVCEDIAINLSKNNVVGLFKGRMEFGARALGNRSIICDPRNPNIKELLNNKIKNREKFRPFAPSVLEDDVKEWFEINDNVPFMSKVYKIRKDKAKLVPGVVHVDGSCRLQSVTKEINLNYYKIINEFKKITSIPMILNTSFNENEPIVCYPSEAIDCFLRTKMDKLYLENYLIYRN